jgi:L-lactate dehydrogenase
MPLEDFARLRNIRLTDEIRLEIDGKVRRAAYSIISGKGATYYGIGSALARIVEVILQDERSILTVCTTTAQVQGVRDVTLALPHLVGGSGAQQAFPLPLSEQEQLALRKSAFVIRQALDELDRRG